LDAEQHDSLINLVESNAGQTSYELADAMARTRLPDGRNMLQTFHTQGKLTKTLTKDIEMVPSQQSSINLAELNKLIAEQRGVTVEDLAVGVTSKDQKAELSKSADSHTETNPAQAYSAEPLSDEKLAAQYRIQADVMKKEALQLIDQANKLDPPKKAAAAKTTTRTKKKDTSG